MAKTSWPIKTLGEVAVLNPSEPALSEDAPFVPMDAVTAGKRQVQYTQPRGQRSGARARAGDILFARITPCLQNGKVALVQDEIERCGGSTEFIVVRAGTDVLNGFLYQWITAKHIRDHVTALMKGATGRQRLNAEDLALTELPVPPLDEQKRIVELLDAATARVTELTACYEQARANANNLFTSALRGALQSNPDWPVKTLGDVVRFDSETARPEDLSSRDVYVGLENIASDGTLIGLGNVSAEMLKSNKARFTGDHILFGKLRPYLVKVVRPDFPGVCSTDILPIKPSAELSRDFLYWYMRSPAVIEAATGASTGTTLPRVSPTTLKSFEISVPPLDEQKRIVGRLDAMRAKTSEMVAAYDAKLQAAKNLRQSILESAFEGKL